MVVLVDFKTETQIQVGAPRMSDFLKPIKDDNVKEKFELERVIKFFTKKVKEAEKAWLVNDIIKAKTTKKGK